MITVSVLKAAAGRLAMVQFTMRREYKSITAERYSQPWAVSNISDSAPVRSRGYELTVELAHRDAPPGPPTTTESCRLSVPSGAYAG